MNPSEKRTFVLLRHGISITCLTLLMVCCGIVLPVYGVSGPTPIGIGDKITPSNEQNPTVEDRYITIDFNDVDIQIFIKFISELTGKNFIVDRTVKGTVTVISPTKISVQEAYRVFESVLEVNGFTTVPAGAAIKIMPSVRARSQNVHTLNTNRFSEPEDTIVTQIVTLDYTTPTEMKKVLAPLVSKTSVVIAHTQSGMLIITDTLSNIQKLLRIIDVLDVEFATHTMEIFPLEYAGAAKIAKSISSLFQKRAAPQKGGAAREAVKIVPYERTNSLIVMGSASEIAKVERLVLLLDTEMRQEEGNIRVVYLQHANAKELATVLTALSSKAPAEKDKGKSPAISKNVSIMADEETNSLIISASRNEFRVLEQVVQKLDIPRRMVYLEALIMEVDADAGFSVGVKWIGGGVFSDGTGQMATSWVGNPDGWNGDFGIDDEGVLKAASGFSLGVLKQGIQIGGMTFPDITALLKAVQTSDSINIIATPQILTTDNKKAEINVGENVPYITSQNTTDARQDYTSYEYKDVSTKLSITPQINQADTLRLEIATEVIKLKGSRTGEISLTPTTYKRTAETTVIVKDSETVVIGGIIGHDITESEWQIPLLGDIPLLGWLFKTHSTSSRKTNMFIFITPHIIKNPADLTHVTLMKEDELDDVIPAVTAELNKKSDPKWAVSLCEKGEERLLESNYYDAETFFHKALDVDPLNVRAMINLGNIRNIEGSCSGATEYYLQALHSSYSTNISKNHPLNSVAGATQQLCAEIARQKTLQEMKKLSIDDLQVLPRNSGEYPDAGSGF